MRTIAKAKHLYVESRRGEKKKDPPYKWNKPKELPVNVYLIDEEEMLQIVLKDRRIKQDMKEILL